MIQIIITLLILFAVYTLHQKYVKPLRHIKFYELKFKEMGYKVHTLPIKIAFSSYLAQISSDQKKGDAFATVKKQYSQYDVVLCNVRANARIILINPKLIKQYYMAEKDFLLSKTAYARKSFSKLAKGILFSEKQVWKRKRRIISNVFNFDFLSGITSRIAELFDEALLKSETASQGEIQFPVIEYTSLAASSVIMECFLGMKSHDVIIMDQRLCTFLIRVLDDFVEQLIDPVTIMMGPNLVKLGIRKKDRYLHERLVAFNKWSHQFIHQKIQSFRAQSQTNQTHKPKDLIEAILLQNSRKKQEDDKYTQEQILDEFKIFLLAGTDTTSNFLQLMIYYISKYPEVEDKVRAECSKLIANENFTTDNLKQTKYIDAVMKQTNRIYGPANFTLLRQAQKDFYLADIPILKNTFVSPMTMATHYSEQYYKEPTKFRPERWLNGQCTDLDPYAHIGFSAGSRSCIGRHLALLQAKIGLIKFMQRYQTIKPPEEDLKFSFKFAYVCEHFNIRVKK